MRHQGNVKPTIVGERSESELLSRYSALDLGSGDGHFAAQVGDGARQKLRHDRESMLHVLHTLSVFLGLMQTIQLIFLEVANTHRVNSFI